MAKSKRKKRARLPKAANMSSSTEYSPYSLGYLDSQRDALAFLRGWVEDEGPIVAVAGDSHADDALWMLGWNLSVAGALKSAELNGKSTAAAWNAKVTSTRYNSKCKVTDYHDTWKMLPTFPDDWWKK